MSYEEEKQDRKIEQLEAEIERLRAKIKKMEFLMRSTEDTCLACAIKLEVIDQQAARIKELEAQLALTTSALENATRKPDVIDATGTGNLDFSDTNIVDDLIKNGNHLRARAQKAETRIKELEDALVEYQRLGKTIAGKVPCLTLHGDCGRCSAKMREVCGALEQIAGGKIGPDAKQHDHTAEFFRPNESPAKSWQITDEREEALHVMGNMKTLIVCPHCKTPIEFADIPKYTAVLRAMPEAGLRWHTSTAT